MWRLLKHLLYRSPCTPFLCSAPHVMALPCSRLSSTQEHIKENLVLTRNQLAEEQTTNNNKSQHVPQSHPMEAMPLLSLSHKGRKAF